MGEWKKQGKRKVGTSLVIHIRSLKPFEVVFNSERCCHQDAERNFHSYLKTMCIIVSRAIRMVFSGWALSSWPPKFTASPCALRGTSSMRGRHAAPSGKNNRPCQLRSLLQNVAQSILILPLELNTQHFYCTHVIYYASKCLMSSHKF